jgi:enoyl-[acyl-carrier protein] reductase I
MMAGLMEGKRGLIMGLANDKSLAWGIAKALSAQGAELAFSYQGAMMEKRVRPLAQELGVPLLVECDVADGANLDRAFAELAETWPTIDFLVHAIGFSDKNELRGLYVDDDEHLGLLDGRGDEARAGDDAGRRIDPDAELLRRREGRAAL